MNQPLAREDYRRQLTLWVMVTAETSSIAPSTALQRVEEAFVGDVPPPGPTERTEYFAVERFEDYLPSPPRWSAQRERIAAACRVLEDNAVRIDQIIVAASPKWRIERMPLIDRTLLRMGVGEMISEKPRARATLNGMIELAKQFGGDSTPAFVNGILDQIRRNLNIPFAS
jgi:transcription termination factor NusB